MVGMGHLYGRLRLDIADAERVPLTPREAELAMVQRGDLLFARRSLKWSGAGVCVVVRGIAEPTVFESSIVRVRLDRTRSEPEFYCYYFRAGPGRQAIESIIEQTAVAGIRASDLARLRIAVPPLPDQQAIAAVLNALDDKIENNRRVRDVAVGLLTHRFAGLYQAVSERVPLNEVASILKAVVKPAERPSNIFEQFSIPAFDEGAGPDVCAGRLMASAKTALPDERVVLLSKLNPATKRVWWPERLGIGEAVCSPEFLVLVPNGVPASWLLGCVAFDSRFYVDLLRGVTGTTGSRQRVRPGDVMMSTVPSVDARERALWDEFAHPILERQITLLREVRALSSVRDALLPKLVSGQIRIPLSDDVEEQVGVAVEAVA